jgi:HK97 family phage portal protein
VGRARGRNRARARERAALVTALQSFDGLPPGTLSIADPALAEYLGLSGYTSGTITEQNALSLTAVYRAQAIIAGTIAGLPLKVYETSDGGPRREIDHWLTTSPAGPYDLSAFSWVETVVLHLLNHGEAYLRSVYNEGGALIGLWPVHPLAVAKVEWDGPDKKFTLSLAGGGQEIAYTGDVTQVLGMSMDGLRGLSPLSLFRQTLQTARAGDLAANRSFTSGSLIAGLVTTEEDVDAEEAKVIKRDLNAKMAGAEHAGDIAFVNRNLKFSPWAMSNADAQFLESRKFSVEEAARIYGMPMNLMSATGAVSNWGTGVAESYLGLQKFTLMGWTSRIESAARAVLPVGQVAEFEYAGLLQGTPKDEIELLIRQVEAGVLTKDEARAIRNLPPLPAAASIPPEEEIPDGQE